MDIVYRLAEIENAAEKVLGWAAGKSVLAFFGEMGAGKTTFIHALCHKMGVRGTVSSPTFSIINEYEGRNGTIYHIDLYRCNTEEEAIRAGVEDCLYSGDTCFVEWPSRAPHIFPPDTIAVRIEENADGTRKITLGDMGKTAGNKYSV